jgi:hypothetical protein
VDRFFLNPWALALAGLAGGIVLLYILKLRRKRITVSSTLLWESSLRDYKANAPWQRLRSNLLMYLQILAILLLALALARPFVFGTALTGGRTVLIIDTSASMLAKDEAPDRLGRALAAAGAAVNDFGRGDEGMIIAAGPQPRVLQSFTKDKGALEAALKRVPGLAGGPTDLDAALRLVSSIAAGSQGRARVVIFSDGAVPDLDPFSTSDLKISYFPVGKESANAGIVSAGARREPLGDRYELFAAVHNYFATPREADLTISVNGEVADVRSLELESGQRREIVLSNLPYTPQPLEIKLEQAEDGDLLAADDEAWVVLPLQQRFKVALATSGESLLLRRVLGSMKDIDLYDYDGKQLTGSMPNPAGKIDIWVVDGDAPYKEDPGASYLFINTTKGAALPVVAGDEVQTDFSADPPVIPTIVGADAAHPVLRYVNVSDLRLNAMRRVKLQPWGRAIVDASEGPLIVEGSFNGQRTLYLAFDLYGSDLPLRAAFPIFMTNALNLLGASSSGAAGQPVPAGDRVNLTAPVGAEQVQVAEPGGGNSTIALDSRGFTLSDTARAGIYRLTFGSHANPKLGQQFVPVSLVSDNESDLAPGKTLRIKGEQQAIADAGGAKAVEIAGTNKVRVNNEFYAWLLGIVLALVALEWFLYHTRAF